MKEEGLTSESLRNAEKFIEESGVHPEIPMSRQEIRRRVIKTMTENNIAFVLADAANSFFVDCTVGLSALGLEFKREQKMKFARLKNAVRQAKDLSAELGGELYTLEDRDFALFDSDFYYNLLKLIEDRIAEDPAKTTMLLQYLFAMPSHGIFNVRLEDFKQ